MVPVAWLIGWSTHSCLVDFSILSLFLAAIMFLATVKPTTVIFGHNSMSDSLCVSLKRRGRNIVSVQRAISTDKAGETKQQTKNASGNITPFSNGIENDHPFLLVVPRKSWRILADSPNVKGWLSAQSPRITFIRTSRPFSDNSNRLNFPARG